MELPHNFLNHLNKVGYPGEISVNDLQQASQGVVKPILQFFMQILVDQNTAAKVKGNLALVSDKKTSVLSVISTDELKKLEKTAALNYLKIKKLKESVKVAQAKRLIFESYKKNMQKLKEKMTEFKNSLKIVENEENKVENLETLSENLVYYVNEQPNLDLCVQNLSEVAPTLAANLKSVTVFPVISEKLKALYNETSEKTKNFNPEEEFLYLGVSLKKENGMYKVEEIDTNTVIERLKKDVCEKRENIWNEFEKTEGVLEEVTRLKEKLKNLLSKQVFTSKKPKILHNLALNLAGKKAQLESLKQTLTELHLKLQEKESQKHLSTSHSSKLSDSPNLSTKLTETLTKHSTIRRELLKKKLQIEEFFKKFLIPLKSSLPDSLTPLNKPLQKELKTFLHLPTLHPFNSPQKNPVTEQFTSLFSLTSLSKHLFNLSSLLDCETFAEPQKFIKKLQNIQSPPFTPLYSIPNFAFNSASSTIPPRKSLESIQEDLSETYISMSHLEKSFEIWKTQPAQHLIPWRKDHYGLNISESLELWKASVLGI